MFFDTGGIHAVAGLVNYPLLPSPRDVTWQSHELQGQYAGCEARIDRIEVHPYPRRHHSLHLGNGQTDRILDAVRFTCMEHLWAVRAYAGKLVDWVQRTGGWRMELVPSSAAYLAGAAQPLGGILWINRIKGQHEIGQRTNQEDWAQDSPLGSACGRGAGRHYPHPLED